MFVIAPVWIGENGRPELRGLFLCFTNGSIVLGQFILSYAPVLHPLHFLITH